MADVVRLKVRRQDGPDSRAYWEEFRIPYRKNMNVIIALMDIQKHPVNAEGKPVAPIVWESSCLEEVCGSCSMVVNGKARQACTALIDKLEQPIRLEPMDTFPVVRDLVVDRSRMFAALKRIHGWIPIDGTYDLGPGPRESQEAQEWRYELSRCMTCGVCMQACPNVSEASPFIGPFAVSLAAYYDAHPTGAMTEHERLEAMMGPDGVAGCGNSQNCVRACPKGIPLTTSIAQIKRETTWKGLLSWLGS